MQISQMPRTTDYGQLMTDDFLQSAFWLLIDFMLALVVAGEMTFVRAGIRFW